MIDILIKGDDGEKKRYPLPIDSAVAAADVIPPRWPEKAEFEVPQACHRAWLKPPEMAMYSQAYYPDLDLNIVRTK